MTGFILSVKTKNKKKNLDLQQIDHNPIKLMFDL